MRQLAYAEHVACRVGASDSSISLRGLFDGEFSGCSVSVDLRRLAFECCRGGWPASLDLDDDPAMLVPAQYLDTLTSSQDDDAPEDGRELARFLSSAARNIGSAAVVDTLARDLGVYTSALPGAGPSALRYYRDADGLEVDAVIELRDGRWGAFEVKLGQNKMEQAVHALVRLRDKVRANPSARNADPSFLAVLVGKTDYAYRTPEGVLVMPITKLGA